MKLHFERDRCQGHGLCNIVSPDLFTLDDDGYCDVSSGTSVPDGLERVAHDGANSCPEGALRVSVD